MWQIVGNDEAVRLLQRSIETGRLAHAYLFVGPPQIGKSTLAREFAKAVNCEDPAPPCGGCHACKKIEAGKHADVQFIGILQSGKEGEEKQKKAIGIDQVRALRREVYLPPYEGRRKIYIIERAEHLTVEAANALLKTLEEPPPGVVLILLTANDKLVLPTVLSRCQMVRMRRPSLSVLEAALVEKWAASSERAKLLARASGGIPGKAIAALGVNDLWLERENTMRRIDTLLHSGIHDRFDYANQLAGSFGKNRDAAYNTLGLWLSWWRDLLLIKTGCISRIANIDFSEALQREARWIGLREIVDFTGKIIGTVRQLDANVNARLAFEVLMMSLPSD